MIVPGPKSLALLALDFPPSRGGIQTLTEEIYSRLADLTRVAVAPAGAESPHLPLVCTRRGAGQGWRTLGYLREAVGELAARREPPWVLHCNHLFAGYAGWWMRQRYGLPYIVWVHGEELSKCRYRRLARASLGGAAAILTNSDFTARLTRTFLAGAGPGIHKIPLGTAARWWEAPAARPTPAPPALPVILTVARLSTRDRYKGVDMALRAMARLRQRGWKFRYRVAGDGDDRGYLEQLARALGVAEEVEFLGRVGSDEMIALYDGCDIFLLGSREEPAERGLGFEGFGIVLLEANARGKPVVAGRSGGIPDAVVEGETGLLVDPLSAEAIADGVEALLRDAGLRARLGEQGRARVRDHCNWDAAAAQVRAVHREVCGNERSPGLGPRGPQAGAGISGARGEAAVGPAPVK